MGRGQCTIGQNISQYPPWGVIKWSYWLKSITKQGT